MITRKSPQEIERMRESCIIVSEVHRMLAPHCRPGVALSELDRMAEEYIRSRGGIPAFKGYHAHDRSIPPFPGTLCVSIDDEVVHGIPDGRVIREGEIVSIDVGVEKNGFYGDGAMTIMVGEVDPLKRRLVEVTREALYRGLEAARPGNRLGDLSAAVQEYVESHGFSIVRDLVGHGIGTRLHEEPAVPNFGRRGTGPVLEVGMTLAVEPMVNAGDWKIRVDPNGWTVRTRDGSASAHFEHTIVVTESGAETLTDHFTRGNGQAGTHHR